MRWMSVQRRKGPIVALRGCVYKKSLRAGNRIAAAQGPCQAQRIGNIVADRPRNYTRNGHLPDQ